MSPYHWPNCPPAVHAQVAELTARFQARLGVELIGLYLHGSLAMGGFNPQRSDLDLLLVTAARLSLEIKRDLAYTLLELSQAPIPIEISSLVQAELQPWRFPPAFDFHYSESWRHKTSTALANGDWQRWNDIRQTDTDLAAHITILNRRGVCLCGRRIPEVFPLVPRQDFWAALADDIFSAEYGLNPNTPRPIYAVLNACRTLAYLQSGQLLSKAEGGAWALDTLPEEYGNLVRQAVAIYSTDSDDQRFPRPALPGLVEYLHAEILTAAKKEGLG